MQISENCSQPVFKNVFIFLSLIHNAHTTYCCAAPDSTAERREEVVCNDLSGLCSGAPALCGPARQLSSPAPPAASADWPELQQQSPEEEEEDEEEGESETLYSTNTFNAQEFILLT